MIPADILRTEERNLLKQQFDRLVHDESVPADSIEKIFDAEFHRRFAELINRVAGLSSGTSTDSRTVHKAMSQEA